jgi:hypothetical protein
MLHHYPTSLTPDQPLKPGVGEKINPNAASGLRAASSTEIRNGDIDVFI